MIFLKIPNNLIFERQAIGEEIQDILIEHETKQIKWNIQELVKKVLQHNKRHEQTIHLKEENIIVYLKRPPADESMYLAYQPNRNGKYPSLEEPKFVKGSTYKVHNPATQSSHGSFWYHFIPLSSDKKESIQQQQQERKLNRRHSGDCPCPT